MSHSKGCFGSGLGHSRDEELIVVYCTLPAISSLFEFYFGMLGMKQSGAKSNSLDKALRTSFFIVEMINNSKVC